MSNPEFESRFGSGMRDAVEDMRMAFAVASMTAFADADTTVPAEFDELYVPSACRFESNESGATLILSIAPDDLREEMGIETLITIHPSKEQALGIRESLIYGVTDLDLLMQVAIEPDEYSALPLPRSAGAEFARYLNPANFTPIIEPDERVLPDLREELPVPNATYTNLAATMRRIRPHVVNIGGVTIDASVDCISHWPLSEQGSDALAKKSAVRIKIDEWFRDPEAFDREFFVSLKVADLTGIFVRRPWETDMTMLADEQFELWVTRDAVRLLRSKDDQMITYALDERFEKEVTKLIAMAQPTEPGLVV